MNLLFFAGLWFLDSVDAELGRRPQTGWPEETPKDGCPGPLDRAEAGNPGHIQRRRERQGRACHQPAEGEH